MKNSLVLGIDTSCDDTAAGIVKDGQEILANVVSSQNDFHALYGGVVPEIASRKHSELINPVLQQVMEEAKIKWQDLDAVAVTYTPGLVISLLVGVAAAKVISYAQSIPLIGINHLEGHLYASFLAEKTPSFPFIALIVSGGHTEIVLIKDHFNYRLLGTTRDDAAGEAFDKVARALQIGYPGGPHIDCLAQKGNKTAFNFPRSYFENSLDFSFSGLKTAVLRFYNRNPQVSLSDISASFQQAVADVLVSNTIKAALSQNVKNIVLSGGVAANSVLRKEMEEKALFYGLEVFLPPPRLCTDNGAMIACAGYYRLKNNFTHNLSLDVFPNESLVAED